MNIFKRNKKSNKKDYNEGGDLRRAKEKIEELNQRVDRIKETDQISSFREGRHRQGN